MAGFCTKCGTPVGSSSGFCPTCGSAISAASAVPAAAVAPPVVPGTYSAPPPAVYGQQPGGYPAAAAANSSGGAMKIVLIVLAVVVGLGVLGAASMGFFAWRVAKSVNMNSNGTAMTMSVPGGGTISAGDTKASDADLGVPAYPGATREKGGMNLNAGGTSMVMAHFSTADAASKVVDFYKSKLGDGIAEVSTASGTVLNSGGEDKDHIMVTVGPGSGGEAGRTAIVVMHTKKM